MGFFSKLFGDANARTIKEYQAIVVQINALEPEMQVLSAEQLKEKTKELQTRYVDGATLDELLPEAFALVREASKRTLGQRHFDVQLMGGIALHRGNIAEMRTGEGKTLVATLATYLNAITGKGVHVVTVNDYLARRDAVWMGQIYHALGLSVACINHMSSFAYDPAHVAPETEEKLDEEVDTTGSFRVVHEFLRPVERREAYLADITYGTNNEFGFDYLRDNMVYGEKEMAQAKGHHYAVVDEIDSILIDEARTPLIISAPDTDSGELYKTFSSVATHLNAEADYTVDEKMKAVSITEAGIEKVEKILKIDNIYEDNGMQYVHHLEEALKAQVLFKRDRDYVVKNNEVIIVDEFTGRLMPGRRWSGGLHQAVEAKEKVLVQKEFKTLGSITFQNYFRLYSKLSGMTGTAQTSAEEFYKVYKLEVITIPTNRTPQRADYADQIYKTEHGKFQAIAREVKERNKEGQPVLIGTVSIQKNEILSKYLEREGVPHKVLNAKNHEQEGEIVAQAGRKGAVTVATNLAGRGVDIILGGNPPVPADAETVKELGGLFVVGTERHEARRIDNQLRGRAGRQGDPGASQFFLSMEDDLVRVFGGDTMKSLMDRLGVSEDEAIQNRFVSNAIEQAQTKIEGHYFEARKTLLEYDNVLSKHRETIYGLRKEIVSTADNKERMLGYVHRLMDQIVRSHLAQADEDVSIKELTAILSAILPVSEIFASELEAKIKEGNVDDVVEFVQKTANTLYTEREEKLGADIMRQLEKMLILKVIDELWIDHLDQMEHLRSSVGLRAFAQRDPLVEYKIEGQRLFAELQQAIEYQSAQSIFKVAEAQRPAIMNRGIENASSANNSTVQIRANNAQSQSGVSHSHASAEDHIGRNDPCPCGSGKKYKKCGLLNTAEHQKLMANK